MQNRRRIKYTNLYLATAATLLAISYANEGRVGYEDLLECGALAALIFPLLAAGFALAGRRGKRGLDRVIFRWSTGDAFTLRDLMRSCLCVGAIGSGKTSGFGYAMAMAILRAGCGVIVFGSKPEELADWRRYAEKAGRLGDFRVFSEESEECCNILECDIEAGLDTAGVVDNLQTIGQTLTRSKSRGDAQFWEQAETAELWFAIETLRLATGKIRAKDLQMFLATAPTSMACLGREDGKEGEYDTYQASFHKAVMDRARAAAKGDVQRHNFRNCEIFWCITYPSRDAKTRGNIEAGLLNTLDVFMRGVVHQKLSTRTTISAADLEAGAIWYVDFSPSAKGASGRFVCAAIKRHVQNHCLRRAARAGDRPIVLWADECQAITNDFDARFIDECRSHNSCMIYLTQSLSNFHMAIGDKDAAEALIGQFGHKVAHAVDPISADYLVKLCGDAMHTDDGGSWSPSNDVDDRLNGGGRWSSSYSKHVRPARMNTDFMTGHRTGGGTVTAWVIRAGEPFADGSNHIFCTFNQEKR